MYICSQCASSYVNCFDLSLKAQSVKEFKPFAGGSLVSLEFLFTVQTYLA